MKNFKILLLPGDGIGPEIMGVAKKFIHKIQSLGLAQFSLEEALIGGVCYDEHHVCVQDSTVQLAAQSDAILFGCVGGIKWKDVPFEHRPEAGLLKLRYEFQLFANIRPAYCYPSLVHASSLKPELVEGLDLIILRELTGGVYFGQPKEIVQLENGEKRAVDNQIYTTSEIERVARVAFELARTRKNKVSSVEKHNVMKTGILWKEVVTRVHANEYADVTLEHVLADNCAMQLIRQPKQFDVIVTDNLFGDILSDQAAMLTGSLGMLPSASLGAVDTVNKKRKALYEPVHGSAPDIAGQNKANPIAMIGSLAMACKYSFDLPEVAEKIDAAINNVLGKNIRTGDIAQSGSKIVGTQEMGDLLVNEFEQIVGG